MKIIRNNLSINDLKQMAADLFGDMVKAVVDIDRELLAVDDELHSDLEAVLLKDGSKQKHLWGINLYPDLEGDDLVEFDSMINIRPSQNNISRGIDSENIRQQIIKVVSDKITK